MTPKSGCWIVARGLAAALGTFAWMVLSLFQPAFAQATAEAQVEELVATGVDRCGPWPLFHKSSLWGCEFDILKEHELATLQTLREKYVESCLACENGTCRPKIWTLDTMTERQARNKCKRLFLTPREIGSLRKVKNSTSEVRPLYVDFTYTIAQDGSVADIKITATGRRNRMTNRASRGLLNHGTRPVLFEPLVINDATWKIVDVPDRYRLDGN